MTPFWWKSAFFFFLSAEKQRLSWRQRWGPTDAGSPHPGQRACEGEGSLSIAIRLNPNKCCAIACCHDNGGLSEAGGRRAVVSSVCEALQNGGHLVFVAQKWKTKVETFFETENPKSTDGWPFMVKQRLTKVWHVQEQKKNLKRLRMPVISFNLTNKITVK